MVKSVCGYRYIYNCLRILTVRLSQVGVNRHAKWNCGTPICPIKLPARKSINYYLDQAVQIPFWPQGFVCKGPFGCMSISLSMSD